MSLDKMVERIIITSAQFEARPNKELVRNIDAYVQRHDARVVVLPIRGKSVVDEVLHPDLQSRADYEFVTKDYKINDSLRISNYEIRPQQINPLTGIKRFAHGDKSFIFGSPKQVLQYVANSYDEIPKAIMTTGAITHPRYNENVRTGRIAKKDHEYGFVVVEKEDNKFFHFRHIKAQKNGTFWDADGIYSRGNFKEVKNTPAFVVGDLHPYDTNEVHQQVTFEQIQHFKPKKVFLHDTFNGTSISHHYKGHNIKMFEVAKGQGLSLEKELEHTAKEIQRYLSVLPRGSQLYLVASNHDEHLYRYLDEGRFVGDKGNDLIASKLYTTALEGKNPLMEGLSMFMKVPKNLHYIERDSGLKVLGYELGNHGDLGANGGRGSPRSIEEANGKSITGHTHSPFKVRDTYKVGTSTNLRLGYNTGYSNWCNTNAVMYNNGQVQLLNTIKGSWRGGSNEGM